MTSTDVAPVEPTEIQPATPEPASAHVPEPPRMYVDQRQVELHHHEHHHYAASAEPEPEPHRCPTVASAQTKRATVLAFVLVATFAALLAVPLWPSPLVALPAVAVLLNTALAVRVATAAREPITTD